MVRFKFFVHCSGWQDGGYENMHFAETDKEAHEVIDRWNENYKKNGKDIWVELLSIEKLTDEEFAEDYIGCL